MTLFIDRLKGKVREQALWMIQNDMAAKNGTLPHEEREVSVWILDEYEGDPDRVRNKPFAHARLKPLYDKPPA
tara:strand:- start:151 stop:369 length:219 start_codon:yes stop_codon:yes gene_type:complete